MKVIRKNPVFYDVDDTLILYEGDGEYVDVEYFGDKVRVLPHKMHCRFLKNNKRRGFSVHVWSQQGHEWAKAVVEALGLEDFVDFVSSKPQSYFDDLAADSWMQRIWVEDRELPHKKRRTKGTKQIPENLMEG